MTSLPFEIRWLYRPSIVMDGNFCAEHLKMRKPEDDVALSDGDGFFTSLSDYELHLQETVETKQVEHSFQIFVSSEL